VLDNYEHLISPSSVNLVVDILSTAGGVHLLVTSRTRLNILDEQVFILSGLDIPQERKGGGEPIRNTSSVRLFESTAKQANPAFQLDDRRLPHVAQISRVLEGMPLAIKLAAVWTSLLEPEEILSRIQQCLDFLETDMLNLPQRHRSLRAVFDSSWALLDDPERAAARRLAVFRDGFTHEAALSAADIPIRVLLALVIKCWIYRDSAGRMRMHEVIRQYCQERLAEAGELGQIQARHLAYYADLADQAYRLMWGADQMEWLRRLEAESGNFTTAVEWGSRQHQLEPVEQALRLVGALYPSMTFLGQFIQGFRLAEHTLAAAYALPDPSALDPTVMVKALLPAAAFAFFQGMVEPSKSYHSEALRLCRQSGDPHALANVLVHAGVIELHYNHDVNKAREANLEALEICRTIDLPWLVATLLGNLAYSEMLTGGDPDKALAYLQEAVETSRRSCDRLGGCVTTNGLGYHLLQRGDLQQAAALAQESLEITREVGNRQEEASALWLLSLLAYRHSRPDEGWSLAKQSLEINWEIGDQVAVIGMLKEMAARIADPGKAVQVYGASRAAASRIRLHSYRFWDEETRPHLDRLRQTLGDAAFDPCWQLGLSTSLNEAVRLVLAAEAGG
jgi:predicted ATPase